MAEIVVCDISKKFGQQVVFGSHINETFCLHIFMDLLAEMVVEKRC